LIKDALTIYLLRRRIIADPVVVVAVWQDGSFGSDGCMRLLRTRMVIAGQANFVNQGDST
jgi:hypothetical protein